MKAITILLISILTSVCSYSIDTSFHRLVGHDTYYLIKINPNTGSNTNGHIIHDAVNEIRKNAYCKKTVFLFPEEGFQSKHLKQFFEEILKVEFTDDIQSSCYIHQLEYDRLSKSGLTELLYIKNGEIIFQEILKFTRLSDLTNFPIDLVDENLLSQHRKILLDTAHYHTVLDRYYSINDRLFQLSDANNRFSEMDWKEGLILRTLDLNSLDVISLYEKFCSPSKQNLALAKKSHSWFKEHNRQSLMINSCTYSHQDSSIYFSISIQVFESLKKDMTLPGKNGELITIQKGSPVGNHYTLIVRSSLDLKVQNIYGIGKLPRAVSKKIYPLDTEAIRISGDTLFVFNDPDDTQAYLNEKKAIDTISCFILKDDVFEFSHTVGPTLSRSICKFEHVELNHAFLKTDDRLFAIIDSDPFIHQVSNLNKSYPIEVRLGEEAYPTVVEEEVEIRFNFRHLRSVFEPDKNVILLFYENQSELKLDVLNKNFVRLQSVRLSFKEDWFPYRAVLHKDNLLVPSIEKDGAYLICIPLQSKE